MKKTRPNHKEITQENFSDMKGMSFQSGKAHRVGIHTHPDLSVRFQNSRDKVEVLKALGKESKTRKMVPEAQQH